MDGYDGDNVDGFVIVDGGGKLFRCWHYGPDWTTVLDDALWFARRDDAEAFAEDDEHAWRIVRASDIRRDLAQQDK